MSASISSFVFLCERLTRIEESASLALLPNATSALDTECEFEEQAEPLDTKIPSEERKCSIVSLFIFGIVRFIICGA